MLRFESTRGGESGADLVWQRNAGISRLELRFDVGLEPAPSYRVQITGPGKALAERVAAVAPDGMAVLLLDVDDVPAGDYRFLLQPQPASPAAAVSYTLRVTDGS